MTAVELYIDPSCPWAWITSRWLEEVAPQRGLAITWRSYCMEIRDDYGVAPTVSDDPRDLAPDVADLRGGACPRRRRGGRHAAAGVGPAVLRSRTTGRRRAARGMP